MRQRRKNQHFLTEVYAQENVICSELAAPGDPELPGGMSVGLTHPAGAGLSIGCGARPETPEVPERLPGHLGQRYLPDLSCLLLTLHLQEPTD